MGQESGHRKKSVEKYCYQNTLRPNNNVLIELIWFNSLSIQIGTYF